MSKRSVQYGGLIFAGVATLPLVIPDGLWLPDGPSAGMAMMGYTFFIAPVLIGGGLLVSAIAGLAGRRD